VADGSRTLTELPEAAREQALSRFEELRPCLERDVPLAAVARELGVTPQTIGRRLARYRRQGLAGLVAHPRRDRGTHRLPVELQQLIEGLALERPRRSLVALQGAAARVAQQQSWPVPSYRVVRTIVQALDPGLLTLAHEGAKAYRERFDLLYRHEAAAPNVLWQADHTPLDVWVPDAHGRLVKPWLTVVLDDYSRAVAAYRLTCSPPTILHTALTLREAIWRKADPRWHVCGIPGTFYTDHGSDFTSRHLEQVAADLNIALVFSEGGMPRGRGKIERFFETTDQLFLSGLPAYAPGSTPPTMAKLTLGELEERLRTFLLENYHRRLHGETAQAPQERWEADGFLPQLPESLEQLDLLLLTVATGRQVRPDGIRFQGLRYLDLTLAAYVGETVTIRYDPRDLAELRVYHRDRFLCRAVCQEVAGQELSLQDIVRARGARRQALRGELTEHRALVNAYLAVHQPEPIAVTRTTEPPIPTSRLKRYRDE
jgi:putative transposase